MADTTNISWCDATFNPWIGCTKVSPACDACYAEALMGVGGRMGRAEWGAPGKGEGTRVRTSAANWKKPLAWNRKAAAAPGETFVFCASLADVFDNAVPTEWRRDLFDLIRATPNLTWLLLTKRPGMIVKLFDEACRLRADGTRQTSPLEDARLRWPRNAAIGCTVVNQEEVDRDVPKLLAAKAALKPAFAFLSMEPLLGEVDLMWPASIWPAGSARCCNGHECGCMGLPTDPPVIYGIDWVITGGETDQGGHKARPTHTSQFRAIRDQCAAAGVAYHHKQNGEWAPRDDDDDDEPRPVFRVGKAAAGRLLDGVEHNARPSLREVK